jgi:hypothetical protein
MTTIYYLDQTICTEGVQSGLVCDEALIMARRIAAETRRSVIVEDPEADEYYRITPAGHIWRLPPGWQHA